MYHINGNGAYFFSLQAPGQSGISHAAPVQPETQTMDSIALYCIVLYCIVLYCIALYHINGNGTYFFSLQAPGQSGISHAAPVQPETQTMDSIALYCIVLYCILFYCIALYHINGNGTYFFSLQAPGQSGISHAAPVQPETQTMDSIALYCIVLYCILFYCIALYHINGNGAYFFSLQAPGQSGISHAAPVQPETQTMDSVALYLMNCIVLYCIV